MSFTNGAQRASDRSPKAETPERSQPRTQSSAPGPYRRSRGLAIASRLLLALAIATIVPMALPAAPAQAACGTAWESRRTPPDTIRVYRVGRGRVDVVGFKRYVQVVMALEWPGYLPRAAREAGATAVKQYAWYHALKGHHRSWYVTRNGVCYDVVDTTTDQLYRPEYVNVDRNVRRSVDATWGLSLRKNGRFFMTGYRTGESVACGRDADGWKLFARSVIHCARNGKDRRQIQRIYYGRKVSFVWSGPDRPGGGDDIAPEVTKPTVRIREDRILGDRIGRVRWSGSDASGIARYHLQRSVDGGPWRDVGLNGSSITGVSVTLAVGRDYRFRVRAKDPAGNWSKHAVGAPVRVRIVETDGARFDRGEWKLDRDRSASGGATRFTRTDGARASLTFTGHAIGYVAPKGPGHGRVRVSIDGQKVAVVDLDAAKSRARRIVFARDWGASAQRTITLVALGNERVDVDAFVVLR